MALFQKIIAPFSIQKYQDDYLILKVSKYDVVRAPFDAVASVNESSCELKYREFTLYISNMTPSIKDGEVKAGDYIGTPMTIGGKTYIGVKLIRGQELQNIIKYLNFKDRTIFHDEPKEVIEEEPEVVKEEPKKTSTKRKSTKKTK